MDGFIYTLEQSRGMCVVLTGILLHSLVRRVVTSSASGGELLRQELSGGRS